MPIDQWATERVVAMLRTSDFRSSTVAEAVIFALQNTFMTGVSVSIDGGETLA
jgi:hypothetical protein